MGKDWTGRKGSREKSQVGGSFFPEESHPGTAPSCYLSPV